MGRKKKRQSNGSNTVFFRESKKLWVGEIFLGYNEDGTPKRKTVYGKTKKEATDKLKQIEFSITSGTFTDKSEITIYHLAKQMIEDSYNLNEIKENTYYRHLSTLSELQPIYNTPLQSATSMQIKDFMLKRINYSQSTINKEFQLLKHTFKEAVKRKIITENPMEDMKKPNSRKTKEKVRALTADEQKRLYDILTSEDINYRHQMLLSMLTGMRMGEINALDVRDVNFIFSTVAVRNTISRGEKGRAVLSDTAKTKAGTRVLPMNDRVKGIFKECIGDRKTGLIFTHKGGMITTNQVNAQYTRVLEKYNIVDDTVIGKVDLHSLRHTYATRCIEGGMQPKVLQKLLGHTDITITMNTYCDAFEAYTNMNLEVADKYLSGILDSEPEQSEQKASDVC